MKVFLTVMVLFGILVTLLPSFSLASPALLDTLEAHLQLFISYNGFSEMTATVQDTLTIGSSTNIDSLAQLIVDNIVVIDTTGSFLAISGPQEQKEQYIANVLQPLLEVENFFAKVAWYWSGDNRVTYALVDTAATVGDIELIHESVSGWYCVEGVAPLARTYHKEFGNGFGSHVATYHGDVTCHGCTPNHWCTGNVECWEGRPCCGCDSRKNVVKVGNSCVNHLAFVGYCGFPAVTFNAGQWKFQVAGFGWCYFKASPDVVDNCSPTIVELILFDTNVALDGIMVYWETASELDNAGFNIHRGLSKDGPNAQLNEALIPAQGDELQGASYSFMDEDVTNGVTYYYWLEDVDLHGRSTMHGPVSATPTSVEDRDEAPIPTVFSLAQNYPNPFNATTLIRYALPAVSGQQSAVSLKIYNIAGQEVRTLVDGEQAPGYYSVSWDGRDGLGKEISSGIYFYRLQAGSYSEIRKMVLLK